MQRIVVLNSFEQGLTQVLAAADAASHGIHAEDIMHVINYDLPRLPEDFVHRIGRTGLASTLVSGAEVFELRSIERAVKLRITRKAIAPDDIIIAKKRSTLPSRTLTALPGEVFA